LKQRIPNEFSRRYLAHCKENKSMEIRMRFGGDDEM
jgi:hypothetical protein